VTASTCSERRIHLSYQWVVLFVLFAGALAIRLYRLDQPPLDFHPTRQYRSALLARQFYFERLPGLPEWRRELTTRNAPPIYEPPLQEWVVALAYRVVGRESLIIPRLLSTTIWLVGGVVLWPIVRRLGSVTGAQVALAFFLFLPFAVQASRSFQPDPLMVTLMLASVLALLRYGEAPTLYRAVAVAAAIGAAVLVKPMCVFQLGAGAGALALWFRRDNQPRRALVLGAAVLMGLLPAAVFYGRSWLSGGSASFIAEESFMPKLLLSLQFWRGWLAQVWKVIGFLAAVVASQSPSPTRHSPTTTTTCSSCHS
jgi:4-amino-4-deoxy-L-arabinose transferase-like glycosyltransferase